MTGTIIKTKIPTNEYREAWDRIFGKDGVWDKIYLTNELEPSMPYITPDRRKMLQAGPEPIYGPGELNFCLTRLVLDYLDQVKQDNGRVSYQDYNDVIGTLECCKLEMYRRAIAPYEDQKCKDNGDVY